VTGKSSKNNKKFTTLPYMWCHLFSQYWTSCHIV
jgi:hypothetical protein